MNLDQLSHKLVTNDECSEALKEMQNNKSPGYDGLTVEFYMFFLTTDSIISHQFTK